MFTLKFKIGISILLLTFSSCNMHNPKSPFLDNIKQGDTLTLFAEYADCGEWGGHIEKLFVTKRGSDFWITFYKDTVSCKDDPNNNRKKIIEKSKLLATGDKKQIIEYINNLLIECRKVPILISNASNNFRLINKDTSFQYNDYTMEWKEFSRLKNKIFD